MANYAATSRKNSLLPSIFDQIFRLIPLITATDRYRHLHYLCSPPKKYPFPKGCLLQELSNWPIVMYSTLFDRKTSLLLEFILNTHNNSL
jgi:hypothetical protein